MGPGACCRAFHAQPGNLRSGSLYELGRRPAISVYVGIDVHRKRSQVAVVAQADQVLVDRSVANGVETVLDVVGDLPIGTPVAFEAALGWGWLAEPGPEDPSPGRTGTS
jgi:hypothetical protein